LDGLVRLGLLERQESSKDRRYQSIRLTEKGEKFVEQLNTECDKYYVPIIESLPDEMRERLHEDFKLLFKAFLRVENTAAERTCCSVNVVSKMREGAANE